MKLNKILCFLLSLVIFSNLCFSASKKEEDTKENEKKSYIGWIDSTGRDIDAKFGLVRLRAKPRLGTFNLGVINKNGRTLPALSGNNEFTSSFFCLKVNNKVYRLLSETNIKTFAQKTDKGIRLLYDIADVAEVIIVFDTLKSEQDSNVDMIKVSSIITNKGEKNSDFTLKAILDTVLGEITANHFYTSDNKPIKDELFIRDINQSPYIYSQNNNAVMQIFFAGLDCTVPQIVSLANYSSLEKNTWDLDTSFSHGFDTVLSYNNSGIGVIWPSVKLSPNNSTTVTFYIAFATDGDDANGLAYMQPATKHKDSKTKPLVLEEENNVIVQVLPLIQDEPEVEIALQSASVEPEQPVISNDTEPLLQETLPQQTLEPQNSNQSLTEDNLSVSDTPAVQPKATGKTAPKVKFDVSSFSQEQLTPEYIQALIDRIVALEDSGTSVNREELLQLNAELDAILSVLRN